MKESEERISSSEEQKRKIRERYKGVDPDSLDFIPAKPKIDIYQTEIDQRVAVYARVSTDDPRQTSSYELQKNYYEDMVQRNPHWILVDIYADEGISGTSLKHRDSFKRMIEDCHNGKIDLIITKSVSRFARNIIDCIGYVRELAALKPPVGVIFETERIYTLDSKSEMSLSFIATLAQEESHNKSEIMNASIEMRFKHGIFLTPALLGYDKDDDGHLVINEDEAETVKIIFFMYLYGYKTTEIANTLNELGKETKRGNKIWSPGSILQILQNERYCGDVLARKTYTPNYLDHKSKKNNKDRNQYLKRDHHDPIISRDDFIAVQQLIRNAKYKDSFGFLPQLTVIDSGLLKGYIPVNPRWAGFSADDYHIAYHSITSEIIVLPSKPYEVEPGSFDLRGYEIARAQFFSGTRHISMNISIEKISFSKEAITKLNNTFFIELLVHPEEKMFAVRTSKKENRNHIQWAREFKQTIVPKQISGAAFLPAIFDLFCWNYNSKFKIMGDCLSKDNESILIFKIADAEMLLPPDIANSVSTHKSKRKIRAFPSEWINDFGSDYYTRMQEEKTVSDIQNWDTKNSGIPYQDSDLKTTGKEDIERALAPIINRKEFLND